MRSAVWKSTLSISLSALHTMWRKAQRTREIFEEAERLQHGEVRALPTDHLQPDRQARLRETDIHRAGWISRHVDAVRERYPARRLLTVHRTAGRALTRRLS